MLVHSVNTRDAIANTVVDLIDVGTTNTGGTLIFRSAASAAIFTLLLPNPAFTAANNGVCILSSPVSDNNPIAGTIASFSILNRDNVEIFNGVVSLSNGGGDIELSSVDILVTDTITITNLIYEAGV